MEAQWAGRQSEGLATAFAPLYSWVYRRKGSVHRIDVGAACGGLELFCIQCVVSLGPAGRKNVRCCGLHVFARAVSPPYVRSWFWLGTSKAQTHIATIFSPKFPSPKNIVSEPTCRSIIHNLLVKCIHTFRMYLQLVRKP